MANLRGLCNYYQGTGAMTRPLKVVCDNNEEVNLEVDYAEESDGYVVLHCIEIEED